MTTGRNRTTYFGVRSWYSLRVNTPTPVNMLDIGISLAGIVPHPHTHYPIEDVRAILEQFSGGIC